MTQKNLPVLPQRIPLPPYPNGWFKICFSDELPVGGVKPVHQFGTELVVFRGEDGKARVLDAYCAHLGAHLGIGGKVVGNHIQCPFHAWEYNGEGQCTKIPYAQRIPPRAQVDCWPTIEQNGYIAVWHHVEKKAPEYQIPAIPEVTDPNFSLYKKTQWQVDTHLQEVFENAVDVPHFVVVHGMEIQKAHWVTNGPFADLVLDLKRDAAVQTDDKGETKIRSFVFGPGLSLTRVTGLMQGVSVQTLSPIDPEKIEICHRYYVHKDAPVDKMHDFFDFYAQDWVLDFKIWNKKLFRPTPVLAEGDGDVGTFRRWYRQFYSTPVNVEV